MVSGISIIWKKYNVQLPALIYRSEFDVFKSHKTSPANFKFNYIAEFWFDLILIFLGVLSILCEKYHWYPLNGVFGILLYVIVFTSFMASIGLVISSINYVDHFRDNNRLINQVKKVLINSNTYEDFCSEMSRIDKRYITQYQKLKND